MQCNVFLPRVAFSDTNTTTEHLYKQHIVQSTIYIIYYIFHLRVAQKKDKDMTQVGMQCNVFRPRVARNRPGLSSNPSQSIHRPCDAAASGGHDARFCPFLSAHSKPLAYPAPNIGILMLCCFVVKQASASKMDPWNGRTNLGEMGKA